MEVKEKDFINELELGKVIELKSADEFLNAVKICHKKYGNKSVNCADDLKYTQCYVIIQENPEKFGRFRLNKTCVNDYCKKNKISWEQWVDLYEEGFSRRRHLVLDFMDIKDKIHFKFRRLSDEKKREFIGSLEKFIKE